MVYHEYCYRNLMMLIAGTFIILCLHGVAVILSGNVLGFELFSVVYFIFHSASSSN